MKRIHLSLAVMLLVAGTRPVLAQQNELAALRAEIAKQQVVIAQLLRRIEALEAPAPAAASAAADLQDLRADISAQQDSVRSRPSPYPA